MVQNTEYIGLYGLSQLPVRCDVTSTLRIHQAYTNCLSWCDLHLWWFVSLTYILRASDHAGKKGMVKSILQYLLVLAPNAHLDMIYRCHVVVCFLDLYVTLGSPQLGRNYYVYIKVPEGATFTLLASSAHIASCHVSSNSAQWFQRSRKSQKFKTKDSRQTCVQNSVFEYSVQVY